LAVPDVFPGTIERELGGAAGRCEDFRSR